LTKKKWIHAEERDCNLRNVRDVATTQFYHVLISASVQILTKNTQRSIRFWPSIHCQLHQ